MGRVVPCPLDPSPPGPQALPTLPQELEEVLVVVGGRALEEDEGAAEEPAPHLGNFAFYHTKASEYPWRPTVPASWVQHAGARPGRRLPLGAPLPCVPRAGVQAACRGRAQVLVSLNGSEAPTGTGAGAGLPLGCASPAWAPHREMRGGRGQEWREGGHTGPRKLLGQHRCRPAGVLGPLGRSPATPTASVSVRLGASCPGSGADERGFGG